MHVLKCVPLSLCILGAVGCTSSGNTSDLQQYVQNVGNQPRGRVEPIPEFKPYEAFSYSASALRSPFSVPSVPEDVNRLNTNGLDIRPDPDRVREYLEQFAIDTLDMVGTLQKPEGDLWALIRDGEGGVVKVRKGEYMGRNHGRVVSVDNDRVNLIEIVPDGQGGWLERPRTLALNGTPGE